MGQQKDKRNPFKFKQFTVFQDQVALPVTTDACLFGAWINLPENHENLHILDIGTGTGLLVFMLAQKFPNATFTGIDIHPPSIQEAQKTLFHFLNNNPTHHIHFSVENMLEFHSKPYEIIISNPPFFSNQLPSINPTRNVARHSNELNLINFIHKTSQLLLEQGTLFLMYAFQEKQSLIPLFRQNNLHPIQWVEVAANSSKSPHLLFIEAKKISDYSEEITHPKEYRLNLYNPPKNNPLPETKPYNLTEECSNLLKDYYIKL